MDPSNGPRPTLPLPRELIQQIASYLPPSSAAALSLSSRQHLLIIGEVSWEKLRQDFEESAAFNAIMAGEYWDNFGSWWNRLRASGAKSHLWEDHRYAVGWLYALVFKKCGIDSCRNISLDEYERDATSRLGKLDIRLAMTPRMVAGKVLLKAIYTIRLHEDNKDPLTLQKLADENIRVCRHVGTQRGCRPWHDNRFADGILPTENHREAPGGSTGDSGADSDLDHGIIDGRPTDGEDVSLQQCCFCVTEYEASYEKREKGHWFLSIRAWHNLGSITSHKGLESEEYCPLWHKFVGGEYDYEVTPICFPLGSVKNAYELWDGSQLDNV
jgi:hypothetical protein